MTTRTIVQELLRRMGECEPEQIAELFAERVDWQAAGSDAVPWLRPRSSRADVADFFETLVASVVPERRSASLSGFLVDGADAVVLGHVSQTLRGNGRSFTIPFALHVTVEDGAITRYHVYEDSFAVAEAVAG